MNLRLVMMKLASTCPNSDMGVVWGLLCLHPNTIKPSLFCFCYFHWNRRPLTICRFWKRWHRKNDPECNFHHYQWIPHFKITLDINFHWKQRTLKFCRLFRRPFITMETVNICQNSWPHLYWKPPKGFPQDLAYILSRVGRIFWPKKIASEWPPKQFDDFVGSPFENSGLVKMTLNGNFIITNQFLSSKYS
jgi:hypothetical protein